MEFKTSKAAYNHFRKKALKSGLDESYVTHYPSTKSVMVWSSIVPANYLGEAERHYPNTPEK